MENVLETGPNRFLRSGAFAFQSNPDQARATPARYIDQVVTPVNKALWFIESHFSETRSNRESRPR